MVDVGHPSGARSAKRARADATPPATTGEVARRRRRDSGGGGAGGRDIVQRAEALEHRVEETLARLGKGRYARVLKMARKPTPEEFRKTSLVTGIGIAVIGAIGFAMYLVFTFIPQ